MEMTDVQYRMFKPYTNNETALNLIGECLDAGYIGEGDKVKRFETELAELLGIPRVLATNSATSAIELVMMLESIGPGAEVITTPMTCTATNTHIVTRGARPVWADVNPLTGLIDPDDVARKVSKRTKLIIGVDWGGAVCDYRQMMHAPIMQDSAHALLSAHTPHPGADYTVWSFQAIKHLTCGDGGALYVRSDTDNRRTRLLRWYGLDREASANFRCEQNIIEAGGKFHMNDIAASIGLANIGSAVRVVGAHQRNAQYYHDLLGDLFAPDAPITAITTAPFDPGSAYWLFTLIVHGAGRRDELAAYLAEHGIETSRVHARNDMHSAFWFPNGPLPGVDYFDTHQLAIPVGWFIDSNGIEFIAGHVREWVSAQDAIDMDPQRGWFEERVRR